jgi:hypothetical protein
MQGPERGYCDFSCDFFISRNALADNGFVSVGRPFWACFLRFSGWVNDDDSQRTATAERERGGFRSIYHEAGGGETAEQANHERHEKHEKGVTGESRKRRYSRKRRHKSEIRNKFKKTN